MTGAGDEEVSEALANLLVAFARWSGAETSANAVSLRRALEMVAPESPTLLTIAAFDPHHLDSLKDGKFKEIRRAAELASAHYKPVWNLIPENWGTVELSAAAAEFADDRDTEVLDRFAKLEVGFYPFILAPRKDRPVVESLDYQPSAWRLAIASWFESGDPRQSLKAKAANAYVESERKTLADAYYETRERSGPKCEGGLTKQPKPDYPKSAARSGYVAAVIVGFQIEDGDIQDLRVLASVPDNKFEQAVLEAMKPVRWAYNETQPHADCSRSRSLVVIPFNFYFSIPEGSVRRP